MQYDSIKWLSVARVEKYSPAAVRRVENTLMDHGASLDPLGHIPVDVLRAYGARPYETVEAQGNLLTTPGLTRLTNLLHADGGRVLVFGTVRLGVGDVGGSAAVGDTDLGGTAPD